MKFTTILSAAALATSAFAAPAPAPGSSESVTFELKIKSTDSSINGRKLTAIDNGAAGTIGLTRPSVSSVPYKVIDHPNDKTHMHKMTTKGKPNQYLTLVGKDGWYQLKDVTAPATAPAGNNKKHWQHFYFGEAQLWFEGYGKEWLACNTNGKGDGSYSVFWYDGEGNHPYNGHCKQVTLDLVTIN